MSVVTDNAPQAMEMHERDVGAADVVEGEAVTESANKLRSALSISDAMNAPLSEDPVSCFCTSAIGPIQKASRQITSSLGLCACLVASPFLLLNGVIQVPLVICSPFIFCTYYGQHGSIQNDENKFVGRRLHLEDGPWQYSCYNTAADLWEFKCCGMIILGEGSSSSDHFAGMPP